jgi:hypothetical protein
MSRQELNARIAAMIATLAETDGAPESSLYIFLDMDMALWTNVRLLLVSSQLITISSHYVKLTEKGTKLANEINAKLPSN